MSFDDKAFRVIVDIARLAEIQRILGESLFDFTRQCFENVVDIARLAEIVSVF